MAQTVYFQEKKTHRPKRKKSKVFLVIFIVLIVFGGLGYLVIYSPVFKIKQIKISGIERFSESEIISQLKSSVANQSEFNKFLGPDNILSWFKGVGNLNKNYPIFENFAIQKSLLSRTIEITVKERERFGAWCPSPLKDNSSLEVNGGASQSSKGEGCWWFDKSGIVFDEAPYTEGFLINKVNDYSGRTLKAGDLVLPDNFFQNFLKVYIVLDKVGLKTSNLSLDNLDSQEIILEASDNSPKIYFSLRFDPSFSISGLNSLKQDLGLDRLLYIDLRTENRVYYKNK